MFSKKKVAPAAAAATPPQPIPPTPTFESVTCMLCFVWFHQNPPPYFGVKVDCSDDALERKLKERGDALNRFFAESAIAGVKMSSGKVKSLAISLMRSFGFSAPFIVIEAEKLVFEKPRAESDDEDGEEEDDRKVKGKGKAVSVNSASTTTSTSTSTSTPL
jgi:hypothetical protein